MRKVFVFGIVFFLLTNYSLSQDYYDSIYVDGHWRTFQLHLPSNYSPTVKSPLVFAFHGGGPLGYQSIQYQSRLSPKSDSAGFVLVYPEGLKIAGNRTWNAGGCCAPATSLNIDDVSFTNALLDHLISTYAIDSIRVYATGFSNGALLCYRLANQLSNRFAAIAPVAGDLMYYPWAPLRAIPIISFHSYQDQNVKYFGGVTIGTTATYFPPQDSIFGIISTEYSCSFLKDTLYHNTSEYDHFLYSNCTCNALIEQYVSYDGEHSWPGGLASVGVNVSNKFSATYLLWEFFQNFTTICNTLDISELNSEMLHVFPDPTEQFIQLGAIPETAFRIVNMLGQIELIGKTTGIIDVAFLSSGYYLLELQDQFSRRTLRFYRQ